MDRITPLLRNRLKADGNYGMIDMVQFPGGYATVSGSTVTFHYCTQDYLGNNRAVVNGTTGAIEQTTAYYPCGAVIADLGTGNSGQPFKFGRKELISANGLNEYDFGARRQYPAIPQFTSLDRFCEKYYNLSPYLYCGNDPINRFDQNGDSIAVLNLGGLIGHSAMLIQHSDGEWHYYSKNGDNIYRNTDGLAGGKGYHDLGEKSFDSSFVFTYFTDINSVILITELSERFGGFASERLVSAAFRDLSDPFRDERSKTTDNEKVL